MSSEAFITLSVWGVVMFGLVGAWLQTELF